MFIEDVAEFTRVLLTTTEMTFAKGWLQIQLIFFCQLAFITGNHPQALLDLRYQHLQLRLICDPDGERPWLFIYLIPEFTKTFLGKKELLVIFLPFSLCCEALYIALTATHWGPLRMLTEEGEISLNSLGWLYWTETLSLFLRSSLIRFWCLATMFSSWVCYFTSELSKIYPSLGRMWTIQRTYTTLEFYIDLTSKNWSWRMSY